MSLVSMSLVAGASCQQAPPAAKTAPVTRESPSRDFAQDPSREEPPRAGPPRQESSGGSVETPAPASPVATSPLRSPDRSPPEEGSSRRQDSVPAATGGSGLRRDAQPPPSASDTRQVGDYLRRLRSKDLKDAEAAFRELWEVEKRLVPTLLRHVEDDRRTFLTELPVIVFVSVAQQDANSEEWVYYVPGLGGVRFDDLASGRARRPNSYKVVLKRRSGFPLGAVVRAALLNRFRSPDYPSGDDRRDPSGWWYKYYGSVRARL